MIFNVQFFKPKLSCYPNFIWYWRALKAFLPTFTIFQQVSPTFTNLYHFLATFILFFTNFTSFYHLSWNFLPSIICYQLLHSFYNFFLPYSTIFYYLPPTFSNFSPFFTNILSAPPILMLCKCFFQKQLWITFITIFNNTCN